LKEVIFGIRLPHSGPMASPESITRIALEAEYLGFDAVDIHDHVSISYEGRYHNSGGLAEKLDEREKLGLPTTVFYESLAVLSYIAGRTNRIKLMPACWVLPWRHPVLFAKQAATLNELSGGRLVCCVCIGNIESDFQAMNVPYKAKGRIMNEYLRVLRQIFSPQREVAFEGRYVSFPKLEFYPKPMNMPMWLGGGRNSIAYARIAEYGEGWIGGGSPNDFKKAIPELDEFMKRRNRRVTELDIGRQTFLNIGRTAHEAKKATEHTIRSFFHGPTFDGRRDAMIQESYRNSLVGTSDDAIRVTQAYLEAGVNVHDIRLIVPSVEAGVEMMRTFSRDVMPSFK
jgi:alkanesulfonate monooxygenase SsuD/methylene tetrahydromethanopterin reductase-like flavin-dependent oxidoreductase (luciferase family)